MSESDRDIEETAGELAELLQELRRELEPRPRRGPLGLPALPNPERALRFADEVALPATIAVLEANVKLLEALQRGVRMARKDDADGEKVARGHARETLSRLDDLVSDLQSAVSDRDARGDADELLAEIDRLRSDLERRLAERAPDPSSTEPDSADDLSGDNDDGTDVPVDVDAELDSLREQYRDDGSEKGDGDSD